MGTGEHATETEKRNIATLVVQNNMVPSEIAAQMGWAPDRVRYYLKQAEVVELIAEERKSVDASTKFGMLKLKMAFPATVDSLITLTQDQKHPGHMAAISKHIDVITAPFLKNADQGLNLNIALGSEMGSLLKELIVTYVAERKFTSATDVSSDPHLTQCTGPPEESNGSGTD
ncbi:hypothetical protein LCGC14_1781720 [marine sediment metagenome]|uniref:Uncharacterized protein n=1 Tax=marine sediment metagenome TaxID=412755 RepID=A0A0F9JA49_9ZZZZ